MVTGELKVLGEEEASFVCSYAGDLLPLCFHSPAHQMRKRHHYLRCTDRHGGFAYSKSGSASTETQVLSAVSLGSVR